MRVRPLDASEHLPTADGEALRRAARTSETAGRRFRRVEPLFAIALWTGLMTGRWSISRVFDHEGRRYVIARRSTLKIQAWTSLSEVETQVVAYASRGLPHKVIADELGMSVSSVAQHLASAASKVGVGSRLELVAAYRELTAATGESP